MICIYSFQNNKQQEDNLNFSDIIKQGRLRIVVTDRMFILGMKGDGLTGLTGGQEITKAKVSFELRFSITV